MKMAAFWVVVLCSLVEIYRHFRGAFCFHHEGDQGEITLMMEAAATSEMSVNFD
jgi:hypothetical protein